MSAAGREPPQDRQVGRSLRPKRRLTRRFIVAALLGLAVLTLVVGWVGAGAVLSALESIGWIGFAAFSAYWLAVLAVAGLAWFAAAPGAGAGRLGAFVWGRILREAAAELLPFAQVGGLLVGARSLVRAGTPEELVFASSMADVAAEVAAQVLYTLLGIGLLAARPGARLPSAVLWPSLAGCGLLLAGAISLVAAQRPAMRLLERAEQRWAPAGVGRSAAVAAALEQIYGRPGRMTAAVALHLLGWIGGALGSWIALRFMGVEIALWAVVVVESLMFAIRGAAFMLPGGLGVQEAAYALIGPLVGLPADEALALSMLKRARNLIVCLPVLAIWQLTEGRALLRARSTGDSA